METLPFIYMETCPEAAPVFTVLSPQISGLNAPVYTAQTALSAYYYAWRETLQLVLVKLINGQSH